ncbi:GntR family transcriptional regulator [Chromobacterium sp. IIBBL 290-4]|uniref:GntR family transcriptional regulator n=1 Tax=Chromobacterium sp. IIBBL 290-4 TaxID=2953890 RepID=UPI0020B73704|nr:GntR family transcriptional regulator [Chromobacterium sp. IIBBL 290-4]UTH75021.1 GntR family transcriptional regulator [Chromobacterium sp. IIBBL 290-4]
MTFKANDLLTEQIAQYLGKQIIQGDMKPGERIQELRIAAELEVSRGSVREALLILQRRHLVDIFPRRGAVVASISPNDVRDFFEMWFLLLERVVQNLAAGWQNDDLARFIELMAQLEEDNHHADLQAFYDHGIEFLSALYRHAGNRYLTETLNDMLPLTQRCLYAILRAGQSQMNRTHEFLESLLKTLIARDTSKLKQMVAEFGRDYSELAQSAVEALAGKG